MFNSFFNAFICSIKLLFSFIILLKVIWIWFCSSSNSLIYESFLYLGPTSYFGDAALDSELNKRNATIRAEDDTYLACLKNNDYLNIIAPKRRFEKTKAIAFLFNTFFFQQINPHIFERNYF